jgi:hypothetical protein
VETHHLGRYLNGTRVHKERPFVTCPPGLISIDDDVRVRDINAPTMFWDDHGSFRGRDCSTVERDAPT